MAVAETAKLIVDLSLKGNFVSQLNKASKAVGGFDKDASRAYRAGQQIGTGVKRGAAIAAVGVGLLATQVAQGLQSLIKLEGMTAQTEAVLKSTGAVAGVTATEVRKLAEQYEALNATVGDEVIQNAENLLLTFTKVNKKAFEPALLAALDMNQALGGGPEGLAGVTKLLGKALQDPEKGLSRLGRAVGGFSDETTAAVKAAIKNNDVLGAQEIILAELTKRYGGSFARAGDTAAGSVAKLSDAWEDLQRVGATALLPTVRNVADALTELLSDPEVQKGAEELGESIASLFTKQNIKDGVAAIKEGAGFLMGIAREVGGVVKIAVDAFRSLPPELQKLAIGAFAVNKLTGGLVTNLAGGLISAVLSSFRGMMSVTAGVVNVTGGVAGGASGAAAGGKGRSVLGAVAKVFLVGAAVGVAAELFGVRNAQSEANRAQATALTGQTTAFVKVAGVDEMKASLAGILDYDRKLSTSTDLLNLQAVAFQTNFDGVRDAVRAQEAILSKQLHEAIGSKDSFDRAIIPTKTAVDSLKGKIADDLAVAKTAITDSQDRTRDTTAQGDASVRAATQTGSSQVVSAIYANRPIITVNVDVSATSVSRTTQVISRYGRMNGSRYQGGSGVLHNGAD